MKTATTNSKSLIIITISSLLLTTALSVVDNIANDIRNDDIVPIKSLINESNYNQSKESSAYYYFYKIMKEYFLRLKRTIYVRLKGAQPDTIDEALEFQSWTLSVLAVIIISSVFVCCFIPLLFCLACKLFGCCTCTACRTCFSTD